MSSQPLPGFRDFFPDDCARRNYLFAMWREVARRYGFVEYDGPTVEPLSLYEKKSGGELVGQLFTVSTRAEPGEAKGALRPEMTPTLARMVAARERDFKKPLKWFCMPSFFRHERQQRGRLREFYQLNCDIIGEASVAADAELLALIIDMMRELGFTKDDFVIRISSRDVWLSFLLEHSGTTIRDFTYSSVSDTQFAHFLEKLARFLPILDKVERQDDQVSNAQLSEFNVTISDLRTWIKGTRNNLLNASHDRAWFTGTTLAKLHELLHDHLGPRDLLGFIDVDFTIVRGLAYYTGTVFEVFDKSKKERALAGGGRYDKLLSLMSDGKVDLPALGFGMGDVVLGNLIDDTPHAAEKMRAWIAKQHAADIYVVIAKEERRADALAGVQALRERGWRVDFPLAPAKVGKQFQTAEQLGARLAVIIGDEFEGTSPQVRVKDLLKSNREDRGELVSREHLLTHVSELLKF